MPLLVDRVELDAEFALHDSRPRAQCRCERCILGPGGQGPSEQSRFLVHLVTDDPVSGDAHRATMRVSGATLWRWAQWHEVFEFVWLPPRPNGHEPLLNLIRYWRPMRQILVSNDPSLTLSPSGSLPSIHRSPVPKTYPPCR
jgi:hypothetical protein